MRLELHLHLEGAAPPELIRQLAFEKKIDLSGIFDARGHYSYDGFEGFLAVYEAACTALRSPDDFARLTEAVLTRSHETGVIYTEVFLAPEFCGGGDLGAWREYLDAIEGAAGRAEARHGIAMRAIPTVIRHLGPERARTVARLAAETAGRFVTGFGMGGAEMAGRPGDFAYAFDMAREAGLGLTCHAGEWGGADMVRDTLDALRVGRIGHGIGAVDDPALMERLAEDDVLLEVCPGSNVALGAVEGWGAHPVEKLRAAGVPLSISTDDPPYFHTDMDRERAMLARHFDWDDATFAELDRVALRHAFCDEATRARIAARLEETA
ncbi:MAG: adenosine deaminase [Paracoccaceae bacterium]